MERFIVILCTLLLTLSASTQVSISMQTNEQQKSQVIDLTNINPHTTSQTGGQQQPNNQQNPGLTAIDNLKDIAIDMPKYKAKIAFGQKMHGCGEACDDCLGCFYQHTYGPSSLLSPVFSAVALLFFNQNMFTWGNTLAGLGIAMKLWSYYAGQRLRQLEAM